MPPIPLRTRRRSSVLRELLPRIEGDPDKLGRDERLVREMVETSLRLLRDRPGSGDLKILNAALRELRYAFKIFAQYRGVRKVTAFGSARTPPEDPAYRTAMEFSATIAARGFMVITGGGHGIMRACQEGAGRERSFGVNIKLPFEQDPNEIIHGDPKLMNFRYFFTRKLMFVKESDAIALFPGGFGTLDEGYEVLTLAQTGKMNPVPIVFLDAPRGTYWKTWLQYMKDHLLRRGLISEEDLALFKISTSVEEAVDEISGFYRVYHSSRYVGRHWVIRLSRPVSPEVCAALERDFAPLIEAGGIELRGPLPEEHETEPELDHLPRLVFAARRVGFGLRRQLIDRLNREG
jgi:uncharacterized protein (TIGR00730 family)